MPTTNLEYPNKKTDDLFTFIIDELNNKEINGKGHKAGKNKYAICFKAEQPDTADTFMKEVEQSSLVKDFKVNK